MGLSAGRSKLLARKSVDTHHSRSNSVFPVRALAKATLQTRNWCWESASHKRIGPRYHKSEPSIAQTTSEVLDESESPCMAH